MGQRRKINKVSGYIYLFRYNTFVMDTEIRNFIRSKRREAGLTQEQLAKKAGVGLRFIRDIEQGRGASFRTDTLNKVLRLFGKSLGPVDLPRTSRSIMDIGRDSPVDNLNDKSGTSHERE